mmetsp:Transcript_6924/g.16458  ORF Transcript_6924/g.16458 Transcript_6924/m.16458 type:complete len:220 (-) Transcript_6924:186-845(-)
MFLLQLTMVQITMSMPPALCCTKTMESNLTDATRTWSSGLHSGLRPRKISAASSTPSSALILVATFMTALRISTNTIITITATTLVATMTVATTVVTTTGKMTTICMAAAAVSMVMVPMATMVMVPMLAVSQAQEQAFLSAPKQSLSNALRAGSRAPVASIACTSCRSRPHGRLTSSRGAPAAPPPRGPFPTATASTSAASALTSPCCAVREGRSRCSR